MSSSKLSNKILPVLVGPTAVGKTSAAIELAKVLPGEIVSADSRQVYRGMEIGSGAPTQQEMAAVPHHLVSFQPPHLRLSAGNYAKMARKKIEDIYSKGITPIVVGGSGLYIKALTKGLSPIPEPDLKIRSEISDEVERRGMAEMIPELYKIDPEYAEKIGLTNKKRLIRALEVYRQTGRCFSDWHREKIVPPDFQPVFIGLDMPRELLHHTIKKRVHRMIDLGWETEVRKLAEHYGGIRSLPRTVVEALGYRELISMIEGSIDLEAAVEQIVIRTRQYAKRQLTWFRADKAVNWINYSEADGFNHVPDEIIKLLTTKIPVLMPVE